MEVGYDCTNLLPEGTKLRDVEEFLGILGYRRQTGDTYLYYDPCDYLQDSGVMATVRKEQDGRIAVDTHSWAFRSRADADMHNWTIKQLRKRFGGSFVSDAGKGRYVHFDGMELAPAESGCAKAYARFGHNVVRAKIYLQFRRFEGPHWQQIGTLDVMDQINPVLLSNNLVGTFLVTIMEDYFRSTFIALLRYSKRKDVFFKSARIHPHDLLGVSDGRQSIEEAVANSLNFQNLERIAEAFRTLDPKLDLAGALRRPYRKRRESLYDALVSVCARRHLFVHRNVVDTYYRTEDVERDVENLKVATERGYRMITKLYGWQFVVTWGA